MYKLSEITLQEKINELEDAGDPHTFLPAFRAALEKQKSTLPSLSRSKYSILGVGACWNYYSLSSSSNSYYSSSSSSANDTIRRPFEMVGED